MGKHKEWRKIAKKLRRKRIRSKIAQERDRLLKIEEERLQQSPRYQAWLQEQESLEEFQQQEEERQRVENHKKWLEEEENAQIAWREKQQRIAAAKEEKERQILLLKEKVLEEEKKKQEALDEEKKEKERAQQLQEKVKKVISDYIEGIIKELPSEFLQTSQTQPGKDDCPFFSKVGACRFFERCSRNHVRPGVSKVLLFQGLYTHFSLYNHASRAKEYDTDISLEYDNTETYDHFDEFFNDVVGEMRHLGRIKLVKVCKNSELHLRGNVYVQFKSERDALRVYSALYGRYYAGKQLSPVFVTIPSWKNALCGQQWSKKCHKGSLCNFLHVFSNPYGEFSRYDDTESDGSPNKRWSSESPDKKSKKTSSRSHHERDRNKDKSHRRKESSRSSRRNSERNSLSNSKRSRRDKSKDKHRNGHSSRRDDSGSRCEGRSSSWSTNNNSAPGWSSSDEESKSDRKSHRKKRKKVK